MHMDLFSPLTSPSDFPIFFFPNKRPVLTFPSPLNTPPQLRERISMSRREVNAIKLDFEDLVKELDQFEQDIQSLQSRINQFMNDARKVTVQMVDIPDAEGVEVGDSGGT